MCFFVSSGDKYRLVFAPRPPFVLFADMNAQITKAKQSVSEMEAALCHFKTFISNMERFIAAMDVEQKEPPQPAIQKPEMYTIRTLAAEFGVCERTVRRYCNEGSIGYLHVRGKIRFTRADVETFYKDHHKAKF